jgi:hypothetical protein
MERHMTVGRRIVLMLGIVLGLMGTGKVPPACASGNPNPKVLAPNSYPYGLSYGSWGARWWQWALVWGKTVRCGSWRERWAEQRSDGSPSLRGRHCSSPSSTACG